MQQRCFCVSKNSLPEVYTDVHFWKASLILRFLFICLIRFPFSFKINIGDVPKVGYFFDIAISIADSEFKIKSLYSNNLILNIASTSKETVQKLKFLDSFVCVAAGGFVNAHNLRYILRSGTPIFLHDLCRNLR